MADLLIETQCQSWLRTGTDRFLSATFPLWGILAPFTCFIMFIGGLFQLLQGHNPEFEKAAAQVMALLLFITLSFLLKRVLASDRLVLNKQGIALPAFIGGRLGLRRRIQWRNVKIVDARINEDPLKSSLTITDSKGKSTAIPLAVLEPNFVEQFVLAAKMWAPQSCGGNLEQVQNLLRVEARQTEEHSYTDLWEDELRRRFCPTAYVPLEPGRLLRKDTVKVVRPLATGGLSALYLCHMDGSKLVVLKEATIPAQSSEQLKEKAREMFDREAQLLLKVDNPGIVHVLDCFCEADRNYMILEYVNGMDLWQLVRQNGPQKESDVLEWAVQIASTMKYLHERDQPIVHRDLTPDNIILRNDGTVVLVDFGAANEFIGTATGTFVGKHCFIAPEQLRGKATIHSDIYAFGCTLYFLLIGEEPEALSASNPAGAAAARGIEISEELCQLVDTCTQLEAADRYKSVAQLLPVLKRLSAHMPAIT